MNWPHIHLMVNHIPIIGGGIALIAVLWGWMAKSRAVLVFAFTLTAAVGLGTYPVMLTGHEAEEAVEDLPWAERRIIHEHEEMGEKANIALVATGVLALVALWLGRGGREFRTAMTGAVALALLVGVILVALTALDGGEIRHDEIRDGPVSETGS